ncbi:hypothetical protein RUND412_007159 [Rhizina undulata]
MAVKSLLCLLVTSALVSANSLSARSALDTHAYQARSSNGLERRQTNTTGNGNFVGDICRFWDFGSALIGDRVLLDKGVYTNVDTVKAGWVYISPPFSIDISTSFNASDINWASLRLNATTYNANFSQALRASIWWDGANTVYKYGGYWANKAVWGNLYGEVPHSEIWSLDIQSYNWTQAPTPSGAAVVGSRSGGYAYSTALGQGFYAGGAETNGTDAVFANWTDGEAYVGDQLLTYDFKSNSFQNETAPWLPTSLNNLVFVPVGASGILLDLGGNTAPVGFGFTASQILPADFQILNVYDIASRTWYTQETNGDIPTDRQSTCSIVATAADNSSFNIFLHGGGTSISPTRAFDDVYVLSLPSFQWILLNTTSTSRRMGHSCHRASNNVMVVVGGRDVDQQNPAVTAFTNGNCDATGLVNLFDLNILDWIPEFTAGDRPYQVAPQITDVIGGDANGGATVVVPAAGWGSNDLASLFSAVVPVPTATVTSSRTSTATSATTSAAKKADANGLRFTWISLGMGLGISVLAVVL